MRARAEERRGQPELAQPETDRPACFRRNNVTGFGDDRAARKIKGGPAPSGHWGGGGPPPPNSLLLPKLPLAFQACKPHLQCAPSPSATCQSSLQCRQAPPAVGERLQRLSTLLHVHQQRRRLACACRIAKRCCGACQLLSHCCCGSLQSGQVLPHAGEDRGGLSCRPCCHRSTCCTRPCLGCLRTDCRLRHSCHSSRLAVCAAGALQRGGGGVLLPWRRLALTYSVHLAAGAVHASIPRAQQWVRAPARWKQD